MNQEMKVKFNKKLLYIIGIFILILLLIPLVLSITVPSGQHAPVNALPAARPSSPTTATPSINPFTPFHGDTYSFNYPTGWTQQENELSNNNGTAVLLEPPGENADNYATVTVEVLQGQTTTINSLTRIFIMLHYTQIYTTVAGVTAMEFTTVIPTPHGDLHSTAYLFEKNNKIYSVKLEYIQTGVNEQLEIQFNQLISSLAIQ